MGKRTVLVIVVLGVLMGFSEVSVRAEEVMESTHPLERVTLSVEGMTCRSCVPKLQKSLLTVPGVKSAKIRYAEGQAVVACDPNKVTDAQLVKAIEDESGFFYTYTAKVVDRTECKEATC